MTDRTTLDILESLGAAMEKGLGGEAFAVLVFKIGEPTLCNYVSNVDRDAIEAAMLEVIARWDQSGVDLREQLARAERDKPAPSAAGASEVTQEDIAKVVYAAMKWAAERAEKGRPPEWVDRGNSLAQDEARRFARDIAAFTASPAPAPASGGEEVRSIVADLVKSLNRRGQTITISHNELSALEKRAVSVLSASPAEPLAGGDAVQELYESMRGMLRLSEMGYEQSLQEPEENGNFAAYERAKRSISTYEAALASPATFAASPASVEKEPWTVEALAQWFHDETEHQESYPHHHWPEHPDDDGNRDGGFVKIVPKHSQAYFRQMAARCLGIRPFSGEYFKALNPVEPKAPAPSAGDVRRVRHKKRGGVYEVIGEAQVQTSRPLEDYEVVVIYRSLNTPDIDDPASPMKGETWVRPKAEFEDGRFEPLTATAAPAPDAQETGG